MLEAKSVDKAEIDKLRQQLVEVQDQFVAVQEIFADRLAQARRIFPGLRVVKDAQGEGEKKE